MKECKYCGTKYKDELDVCPNCGGNLIVTAAEIAEATELAQKEKENQKRSVVEPQYQLKKLIGIVAGVIAAIIVIVVVASYAHNHRAVNGDLSRADMAEAYEQGTAFYNSGDYASAITELGKVSAESKYYDEASVMLQDAVAVYSADALSKASAYANTSDYKMACSILENALQVAPANSTLKTELASYQETFRNQLRSSTLEAVESSIGGNDYPTAIQTLSAAVEELIGDIELDALLKKYKSEYRDLIIDQADAALRNQGYEVSIDIVNQGLLVLPNDSIFLEAIEDYRSYKPIWLIDIDYFAGTEDRDCTIFSSEKDNAGNTYINSIASGNARTGDLWNSNFDRTYLINGKYSYIHGIIYQTYESRSGNTIEGHQLIIYGDGEVLYNYKFSEGETAIKPIDFNVDIIGVQELRVFFKGSCARDGHVLSLGDVSLHPKSKKETN